MNFYRDAEKVFKDVQGRKGSLKSLTLGNSTWKAPYAKRVYALLIKIIQSKEH